MRKMAGPDPSFLRMPGGNYLEGNTIAERYQWKQTIGPIEQRSGHPGTWGYRSDDGLGLLEFLEWCQDLHMQPLLAVWAGYALKRFDLFSDRSASRKMSAGVGGPSSSTLLKSVRSRRYQEHIDRASRAARRHPQREFRRRLIPRYFRAHKTDCGRERSMGRLSRPLAGSGRVILDGKFEIGLPVPRGKQALPETNLAKCDPKWEARIVTAIRGEDTKRNLKHVGYLFSLVKARRKLFNVGDRSLPERHALFPRRIDA
jgi:hypothetical protein